MAVFLGYNQYWPGEFMFFVFLFPGAPEGSIGSGFGFKVSQKTGPQLKRLLLTLSILFIPLRNIIFFGVIRVHTVCLLIYPFSAIRLKLLI